MAWQPIIVEGPEGPVQTGWIDDATGAQARYQVDEGVGVVTPQPLFNTGIPGASVTPGEGMMHEGVSAPTINSLFQGKTPEQWAQELGIRWGGVGQGSRTASGERVFVVNIGDKTFFLPESIAGGIPGATEYITQAEGKDPFGWIVPALMAGVGGLALSGAGGLGALSGGGEALGSGLSIGAGGASGITPGALGASGITVPSSVASGFGGTFAAGGAALPAIAEGAGSLGSGISANAGGVTGLSPGSVYGVNATPGALEGLSAGLQYAGPATAADAAAVSAAGAAGAGNIPAGFNWLTGVGAPPGSSAGAMSGGLPGGSGGTGGAGGTAGTGTGTAVPGTALSRLMDGTATTADYLELLGKVGGTALGVYGSAEQADSLRAIADQARADRAPFLAKSLEWLNNPAAYSEGPGKYALDATLRSLSATYGNPIDSPTALAIASDVGNKNWQNAVTGFGNIGLSGEDTRANLQTNAVGADANLYNALGYGLDQVTAKQRSLADLLKQSQSLLA